MNGPGHDTPRLRAAVRAALAPDDLEPTVHKLLELRFPEGGQGASLEEVGAALSMSPAMAAHIEFAALCAIAARQRPRPSAIQTTSGPADWLGRPHPERTRA